MRLDRDFGLGFVLLGTSSSRVPGAGLGRASILVVLSSMRSAASLGLAVYLDARPRRRLVLPLKTPEGALSCVRSWLYLAEHRQVLDA